MGRVPTLDLVPWTMDLPLAPDRMTDSSENSTFPRAAYMAGKKSSSLRDLGKAAIEGLYEQAVRRAGYHIPIGMRTGGGEVM